MKSVADVKSVIANLTESQWKELYMDHARGDRSDLIPFPSEKIQETTNGQKGEITAKGAISILDCIMSCLGEVTPSPESIKEMRVLDYGCGWGRITRLLPFYFNIEGITGVDVDKHLIDSANKLLPFMNHHTITSMKPLPFEDASFDVVFANSVFSHLSEKSALFTLAELSRILGDGGILVISILDKANMDNFYSNDVQRNWITRILGRQDEASSKLRRDDFIWGDTGRWHEYGIAIINDNWIINNFDGVNIKYHGTKRGAHRGTQNYKYGVKAVRVNNL